MPTIISAIAVIAMCAFIFYMSDQPADDSTEVSMGIVDQIVRFFVPGYDQMDPAAQFAAAKGVEHVVRKIAHFFEYALLGMLVFNLARRIALLRKTTSEAISRWSVIAAWGASIAYAIADEIHQLLVPGRAGMIGDVFIDACGAAVGILILAGIVLVRSRRR